MQSEEQCAHRITPPLYASYYGTAAKLDWYEVCAPDKARNILDLCLPLNAQRVLDVGAGNGSVLQRYLDGGLGAEVHAVEISDSGLVELRKRMDSRFIKATAYDGVRIPYPNDSFDLAILSHVLEHVEHPRLLLHEIRRVAKRVYIEVPLECLRYRHNLRGDWAMDTTGHINYYSEDILRRQLQTSGWHVDRIEVRRPSPDAYTFAHGKLGLLQWLAKCAVLAFAPRLASGLFCWHCAALCTRDTLPGISLGQIDARLMTGDGAKSSD